jgi:hypothetical protein
MKISKANTMENLIHQITVKSAAAGGIYTWLDSKINSLELGMIEC